MGQTVVEPPVTGSLAEDTRGAPYRHAIRAFGAIADLLDEANDLDEVLHAIAARACELVNVRRCSVYLRDEEEPWLFRGRVAHADQDIDAHVKRLVAGVDADRFTREIVETKRPVLVRDAIHDPRPIRSVMRAWNVRAMLGVPMVLRDEVVGILFLDNEDEPHPFEAETCETAATFADLAAIAIEQARTTEGLRCSVRTVVQQNDLMRRAAALDDRLTRLVLDGASLTDIVVAVAELLGKPCAVHGADLRRMAAAAPPAVDAQVVPRLLDRERRDHPMVRRALASLAGRRSGIVGPLPEVGLAQRFLVAPVVAGGERLGYLVIMEYGRRFGRLDAHVAVRAATTIGIGLAAERRVAAAEWDARASLAFDLVRRAQDVASLQRRAEHVGIDLYAPHVLCIVGARDPDAVSPPDVASVAAAIGEAAGEGPLLATGAPEGVIAIVPLPDDRPALEAVASARGAIERGLDALGCADGIAAAVSTRCTEPGHYERAYREARQVMSCVRTFAGADGPVVLTADDLGPGRLFLAANDRAEADRYAQDTLGPLLADDEAMRDLLSTLRTFFDCSRSVRRAAVALGIHENTIRYRLARIKELTGLGVATDSDDQLAAQLALLVLRLEGRLPQAAPARSAA
jgi:GAF domain-containing protein